MAIDDLLRVARWAQGEGRRPLREAMLTLAVAEAAPGEGWAGRCRARLLSERPGHFLGTHPSLEATLADPRVAEAVRKLRGQYPMGRVGWLRFRSEAEQGFPTGEAPPLEAVLDDLIGPPAEADVRRDAPEPIRGPRTRGRVEIAELADPDEGFYLAVLLSIALLLATVRQEQPVRAA